MPTVSDIPGFNPSTCETAWVVYGKPDINSALPLNASLPSGPTINDCFLYFASFGYIPSYGGNVFYATFFGVFLLLQIVLGISNRTWGFLIGMASGLILEVIGYGARVGMANNPFDQNPFLAYLITLTIGPVFMAAAIYLAFGRVIQTYGTHLTRFSSKFIAVTFMLSDLFALILQAVGGAIADTAQTRTVSNDGKNIMIAGLATQVFSLVAFLGIAIDFIISCARRRAEWNPAFIDTQERFLFKAFQAGTIAAAILILIRSAFRVAELCRGFGGPIWNNEVEFMVLDGAMVALATIILTVLHPGIGYGGSDAYRAAGWHLRRSKIIGVDMKDEE